ncbi:MAG: sterol desaturase family protein [Archangium sp.]|nr:sterol desaturase family protein [Archangium sp.]
MKSLLAFVVGVGCWPVAEYWLHRVLGHVWRARTPFRVEHIRHHAEGAYFAPGWKKAVAAALVVPVASGCASLFVDGVTAVVWGTGFSAAYLGYELLHRQLHLRAPRTLYGRWVRAHHFTHHFAGVAFNHAVTLPVLDRVFGTARRVVEVDVPRRLAPTWLVAAPEETWRAGPSGPVFRVVD